MIHAAKFNYYIFCVILCYYNKIFDKMKILFIFASLIAFAMSLSPCDLLNNYA
jgi:hypothetical protein